MTPDADAKAAVEDGRDRAIQAVTASLHHDRTTVLNLAVECDPAERIAFAVKAVELAALIHEYWARDVAELDEAGSLRMWQWLAAAIAGVREGVVG